MSKREEKSLVRFLSYIGVVVLVLALVMWLL